MMVRLGLSNDPVGFGGRFAALRRLRSRLMAMQRLHHRDARHQLRWLSILWMIFARRVTFPG
jgi:hypothetical protein